ncbi:MAG: hypothetical protein PHQ19_04765 [Candidatus Krumholzibacteria bacterium]|nr:hypothetical protein [Candidatus Krumholzibacteria bacterium]
MRRILTIAIIGWAAALTGLAVLAADCRAQAYWFGKNKVQYKDFEWSVLKTPHFDVHFPEGYRDLAARTAVILEYGYNKLSEDFEHGIEWRIPAIVYGSHSDFQQTNVTWDILPEGVQAFAEPTRKRMVLHFGGSNLDYAHTCIHELTHIFEFDIIYGTLLRSAFAQGALFPIPLWFMEGISEYYSVGGMDDEAHMFMRDATVFDYLPYTLDYAGGYMNYKAGQSAIDFINRRYGPGKVVEIMDQLRYQRSLEIALKSTIGITTEEFSKDWKEDLRRTYWPLYADKNKPEDHGRRVTDHVKQHHYQNTKPEFSPDGEYIVYYSDRSGLDGIYLMDALKGTVEKKLLVGSLSERFESIRTMRSSLTWSPDGERIAFVAKSDGSDRLFLLRVSNRRVEERIDLPLDFFHSPAWSPDGGRIAVIGTLGGVTDIFVYNLGTGALEQVTDDRNDENDPAWFPDGSRIAYARYPLIAVQPVFEQDTAGTPRLAGVDLQRRGNVRRASADIWSIDLVTGEKREIMATPGDDDSPQIMLGGREILFASDETGIRNLYRGSLSTGGWFRFTDVLGGIFAPSLSERKDRLVFSAFNEGGYDLFIMDEFERRSGMSYSAGVPGIVERAEENEPFGVIPDRRADFGLDGGSDTVSVAAAAPRTGPDGPIPDAVHGLEKPVRASVSGEIEGIALPGKQEGVPAAAGKFGVGPGIVIDEDSSEDIHPDTLEAIRERMKEKIGTIEPYSLKFSPDYIGNGMGLFFSTGIGFGLMNQIAFSDLLGDHHFFLQFSLYGSLEDSDIMLSYYYLKRRLDYSFGIFQFKNYLNSRVSSVGEIFLDYRYFTERNYGVFANASYPFSMFSRVDLDLQAFISEREFYSTQSVIGTPEEDLFFDDQMSQRRLIQPALSLVHDSAYYGYFGPVIGTRWMISASRAISFSSSDVSRSTVLLDFRKYFPLWHRNSLAVRAVASASTGTDRRFYFLGGPMTLRGYEYLQFQGPRMALLNVEYRYPLIDALIFGWPGRWGLSNIGGTVFFDTGSVWGEPMFVEPLDPRIEPRIVNGLKFYSDFGLGFFMRFGAIVLDFQLAWPTDFDYTGRSVFHFYIGPQF